MQLHETYRPSTWAEVIGQPKAIAQIEAVRRRGLAGRAYWISGASGTGKSTIALLLANEIAEDWSIEELDASTLTPARVIEIERQSAMRAIGSKPGRAYLVNEAHGLSKAAIRQLLVALERVPGHVVWIFTTTSDAQDKLFEDCLDAHPLLSRCVVIALTRQGLAKPFAERAREIAQREQLDGKPIEQYVALMQKHKNNLRAALQEIEAGGMQ